MNLLITDLDEFIDLVDDMMGKDFCWDYETEGLNPREHNILGAALAYRGDDDELKSVYVAFTHTLSDSSDARIGVPHVFISLDDAIQQLSRLFDQTDVLMIGHNTKFDMAFSHKYGLHPKGQLYDTMIAAFYLDENQESYSLKSESRRVFGYEQEHYQNLHYYTNYEPNEFLATRLEDAARYASDDSKWAYKLMEWQLPRLESEGVDRAFWELGMELQVVLCEMEEKGIRIDRPRVEELLVEYSAKAAEAEKVVWAEGMNMIEEWIESSQEVKPIYLLTESQLRKTGETVEVTYDEWDEEVLVKVTKTGIKKYKTVHHKDVVSATIRGRPVPYIQPNARSLPRFPFFNVGSRMQVSDLLFDYLDVEIPTDVEMERNKDGTYKVDKDTLAIVKFFLGDRAPSVVDTLLEWRKAEKLVGTYLKPWLNIVGDGDVIHANFNQHIARTGRLSSSQPNMQNISARGDEGSIIRSLFIAREGHSLVVCDASQLELRIQAALSGDEVMIDAFVSGKDLHSVTAAGVYGVDYETFQEEFLADDKLRKKQRMVGKTLNFAAGYGMGPKKFQRFLVINADAYYEISEIKEQLDGLARAYPTLQSWKKDTQSSAIKNGFVRTISKRKRRLPNVWSRDSSEKGQALRQATNAIVQGTAADIMGRAMVEMQPNLRKLGGSILLQVHDEVVCEVPKGKECEAIEIIESAMLRLSPKMKCPLSAEASSGSDWYSAKG